MGKIEKQADDTDKSFASEDPTVKSFVSSSGSRRLRTFMYWATVAAVIVAALLLVACNWEQ
jgi:hypothetical protein